MSGTRAAGWDGERRSSSLSVRGGLWKFTNPHPSTLTCVSLTMETFSLWVGGGITLRRERKKRKENLSRRFLDHATSGNLLQLRALYAHAVVLLALISDCQQSWTKRQPHAASHLEWLLKILLRGRACAVQTARWGLALKSVSERTGNF